MIAFLRGLLAIVLDFAPGLDVVVRIVEALPATYLGAWLARGRRPGPALV
jgi:hypothetical protein